MEGGGFGGGGKGSVKSNEGGMGWKAFAEGLPQGVEANIAIAPSNPKVLYATVAGATANNVTTGQVGFYKSVDAGEHWTLVVNPSLNVGGGRGGPSNARKQTDPPPLGRNGRRGSPGPRV